MRLQVIRFMPSKYLFSIVFVGIMLMFNGCGNGDGTSAQVPGEPTQPPPVQNESALNNWHLRSPSSNDENLNSVIYGNGLFVSVGDNGTIRTSRNLTNWATVTPVVPEALNGITYGNGIFVAVGGSYIDHRRAILTSADGKNWTVIESVSGDSLNAVNFADGIFFAVGGGWMLTSVDGSVWTERSVPISLYGVTYAEGIFVAVGENGIILTSPDGANWTKRLGFPGPGRCFRDITYANGTFVAVGTDVVGHSGGVMIYTSSDGLIWTEATGYPSIGGGLSSVAFGSGVFVAVGSGGTVITSADGKV